jgi:hypothetical protein
MKWIDGNLWLLEDQSIPAEKWERRSVIGTVEIGQGEYYEKGPGWIWISKGGHSGGKLNNELAKMFSPQSSDRNSSSNRGSASKSAKRIHQELDSEVQEDDMVDENM